MPGRPRKPTAIKILEGNRGRRPLNAREPQPLIGEPSMPKHLDAIARREWRHFIPILLRMRVLSEADGVALGNLCTAYSILVRTQKLIHKQEAAGKSLASMRSEIKTSNEQMAIMNGLLAQFGLTPASRSRVVTNTNAQAADSLEMKLCG